MFSLPAFEVHFPSYIYTETETSAVLNLSWQVSKERGEQLAIEYGIKFMETSAKASINVEDAFFTLARDIKVYNRFETFTHYDTQSVLDTLRYFAYVY